uniref:Cysteine protease n=1 Tax=Denticeps clupeoides TaxID=299321 RepID=A0AAY4BSD4_9TELE
MHPESSAPEEAFCFLSWDSAGPGPGEGGSAEGGSSKDRARLKGKLVSAWNTFKYVPAWSLKSKPRLNKTSPVVLLGRRYTLNHADEREHFRCAFSSLLWLTYRRGFPQLSSSAYTTDCGWGCMLRSGQMLLAQGLRLHLLPHDWTWSAPRSLTKDDMEVVPRQDTSSCRPGDASKTRRKSLGSILDGGTETTHRQVVAWFGDQPLCPFGLHQLVEVGRSLGKKAGDWYGPSVMAHIIRKAVCASEVSSLAVYVAQDCAVYKGDVTKLCEPRPSESATGPAGWRSVIILVPVRLGGDAFNPAYTECLKGLLNLKCCIGIMGGRPKHSLFFVGFQDQLLYLDPHYSQPVVDVCRDNFPLQSFHCKSAQKMPFTRMDPSCTVGFYAQNQRDFVCLCSNVLTTSMEMYPMFTFVDGRGPGEEAVKATPDPQSHFHTKVKLNQRKKRSSMDEFVLL